MNRTRSRPPAKGRGLCSAGYLERYAAWGSDKLGRNLF